MNTYILLLPLLLCTMSLSAQVCPGTQGQIVWEAWQQLYDDELGELTALPDYPSRPHVTQIRYNISAPVNYDNYFGGRMRGFIYVPTTTTVTFNLTGNQITRLYLSTDADPANKTLIAYTDDYTEIAEHDKYPSQTSASITLSPGTDYYFEVLQIDRTGSDHAKVWWMTDLVSSTEWTVVSAAYLKGVDCTPAPCAVQGTPCDDGDAATSDDVYDGYCHCVGTPTTTSTCVGSRGHIEAYYYDTIPGGSLSDLYAHPDYPAMPYTSRILPLLGTDDISNDNEGSLVQTYLTVPVSGNYKFNITGDDQTALFISSDDDPANKQAHQALALGWTNSSEHDKYLFQSTGFFYMEAGQYYYLEVNSKQGGGSQHFGVFWQTPFTEVDTWKRIPSTYLYDYTCQLACIPAGTLCDDGDPFTNSDMYDADCNCVGVPCSGPDCDNPLANYIPYDKCGVTDQLDNNAGNNWLSCTTVANPNTARAASHWIMYDLEVEHRLFQTHVWNYNEANEVEQGFEMVAVDYSMNGTDWTTYGTYSWPLADGSSSYAGFMGPDFMGTEARYILITSLDNTSQACRGLGKIAFTAISCPDQGSVCDDGDPDTTGDVIDEDCNCTGINLLKNKCDTLDLVLGNSVLATDNYSAINTIESISTVEDSTMVSFIGGKSVTLNVGFAAEGNSLFIAAIDTCDTSNSGGVSSRELRTAFNGAGQQQRPSDLITSIEVIAVPDSDEQIIRFYIDQPGLVKIVINDTGRQPLYEIANHEYKQMGLFSKRIRTHKLDPGVYLVQLSTATANEVAKMTVR